MKNAYLSVAIGLALTCPSPLAARPYKLSSAQITQLCRPELEAHLAAEIKAHVETIAYQRSLGDWSDEKFLAQSESELRDMRAKGINSEVVQREIDSPAKRYMVRDDFESGVSSMQRQAVSGQFEYTRTQGAVLACNFSARLAAMDGLPFRAIHSGDSGGSVAVAPPAKAAVWSLSESLSSLSINGSSAPAPPGKDAHIIAADGKSAMSCVKLVRVANGDSNMTGTGGRVLSNQCSDAVEAGWCYSPGDCDTESGSSWTIRPGRSWPIKSAGDVRWAACHGANTQSFVKGSHGLRYYCTAPK